MKKIISITIFLFPTLFWAQYLQVPPRNLADPNGDQFIIIIESMSLTNREDAIFNAVLNGNIPDFQRNLIPVTDSIWNGTGYTDILYYVLPDYLAIGDNANYYLCPMTPILAQKLCDSLNCILPTRKMVNRIWASAPMHLNPQTIPPSPAMITVPVMADHDSMVWNQRSGWLATYPLGTLTAGDKKDVILSNYIYAYPPPDRVVIYGWHYTSGTPIQPMYAGHESTYADYSHGIRFVQNLVWVDGVPTTATAVLTSPTLNPLLSDEGIIDPPRYPIGVTVPAPLKPTSFCVLNESSTELRIKIKYDSSILFYKIYTSTDGIIFNGPTTVTSNNIVLTGLNPNQIYYIKFTATNASGESPYSEVLAASPSSNPARLLFVNGYDRPKVTNTYDFVRYHAPSILQYGLSIDAATNEAYVDSTVVLNDYEMVDYLLGEESTANETFSLTEQNFIKNYLDNGGKLLVSGAEIGWDLHHLGSATDSIFYKDYLKSSYVFDAPNNQSGTYYNFNPLSPSICTGLDTLQFDNGSYGIYNVVYPDVINPINGGEACLEYTGLTNNYAAISFEGLFPLGTNEGKLVYMGFPFETIITENARDSVMKKVLDFFTYLPSTASIEAQKSEIMIYPNPVSEMLNIQVQNATAFRLQLINNIGIILKELDVQSNSIQLPLSELSNGLYFVQIEVNGGVHTTRIIKN